MLLLWQVSLKHIDAGGAANHVKNLSKEILGTVERRKDESLILPNPRRSTDTKKHTKHLHHTRPHRHRVGYYSELLVGGNCRFYVFTYQASLQAMSLGKWRRSIFEEKCLDPKMVKIYSLDFAKFAMMIDRHDIYLKGHGGLITSFFRVMTTLVCVKRFYTYIEFLEFWS